MRRREIIAGLLGLTASMPLAARAQQSARPIIGFLGAAPASGSASRVESLRAGLRDFGYTEDNTLFEFRWVEQPEQLRQFAAEIVERQPAAIVTSGNAATLAAKAATSTIPIVFSVADDPVRLGFVASFNSPGGQFDRGKSDFRLTWTEAA